MKVAILLPIIMMSWMSDLFHPGIVSGYVKDIDTGKPVQGATISIYEDINGDDITHLYRFFKKTDKDGFFKILVIPGKYQFFVEIPGIGFMWCTCVSRWDFYDLEIKKDQHIKFIVSIGKREAPFFEKKVSEDGNEIRLNMLYIIIKK